MNGIAKEYITAPNVKGEIKPPATEWIAAIEALAPERATVHVSKPRKILVFSLATGFKHTIAPHVKEVVKVLGEKTGVFEVEFNDDISVFE